VTKEIRSAVAFLFILAALAACGNEPRAVTRDASSGVVTGQVVAKQAANLAAAPFWYRWFADGTQTASIEGATVLAYPLEASAETPPNMPVAEVDTSPEGEFELELQPGKYRLIAEKIRADGEKYNARRDVQVYGGAVTDLGEPIEIQEAGALYGLARLADVAALEGHAGIVVVLDGMGQFALTDEWGAYAFPGVPAGEYAVEFDKVGYAAQRVTDVSVAVGKAARATEVTLAVDALERRDKAILAITVVDDGDGAAVSGALVSVRGIAVSGVSDAGGWLELAIDEGEYTLFGVADGYGIGKADFSAVKGKTAAIELRLPASAVSRGPALVRGTVSAIDGALLASTVVLSDPARGQTQTDNRGQFALELPQGCYTLTFAKGGFDRTSRFVCLDPGMQVDLGVVTLPPDGLTNGGWCVEDCTPEAVPDSPPAITIAEGAYTRTTTIHVSFAGTLGWQQVQIAEGSCGGPWQTLETAGSYSFAAAIEGDKVVTFRFLDWAGNESACIARTVRYDISPPELHFRSVPFDPTNRPDATFSFYARDASPVGFRCRLNDGAWASCASPWQLAALAPGTYTLDVEAADAVSLTTQRRWSWEVRNYSGGWRAVHTNGGTTWALDTSGALWCWGVRAFPETYTSIEPEFNGTNYVHTLVEETRYWSTCPLLDAVKIAAPTLTRFDAAFDWASVSIAGFGSFGCGLKTGGALWCWGENSAGQLGRGVTSPVEFTPQPVNLDTDWAQVTVHGDWDYGLGETCALKTNGTLWCWGGDPSHFVASPARLGPDTDWVALDGTAHALKADGSMWAIDVANTSVALRAAPALWASVLSPGYYQETTGVTWTEWYDWANDTEAWRAVANPGDAPWAAVVRGESWEDCDSGYCNLLGITTDGRLWAYDAHNRYGTLGTGLALPSGSPAAVSVGTARNWVAYSYGEFSYSPCALNALDEIYCWGINFGGNIGQPDLLLAAQPAPIATGSAWRPAGDMCWLDAGVLRCWSMDARSEAQPYANAISRFAEYGPWHQAETSMGWHGCSIRTDGTLWCWGYNDNGQLGNGTTEDSDFPVQVGTDSDWAHVDAIHEDDNSTPCALKTDGTLWCWGASYLAPKYDNCEVFDEWHSCATTPQKIGADQWLAWDGFCGVRADTTLWCRSKYFDSEPHGAHRQVTTATGWASVDVSWSRVCATKTDGTLWCFGAPSHWSGANPFDDLGIDPASYDTCDHEVWDFSGPCLKTPRQVGAASNWAKVEGNCGLRTDGTLWCWGHNTNGDVGNGAFENVTRTPTQVGAGADWVELGTGCAVKADGSLWCWGYMSIYYRWPAGVYFEPTVVGHP
jgi:hypothetical protein